MGEIKKIITLDGTEENQKILTSRADEVAVKTEMKEARGIISELKKVIRKNNLTSLSAPALGYNKRIFCINFSDSEIKTFINPVIMKSEGIVLADEHCTSLPDKRYLVPRNNKVELFYTTPLGKVENRMIQGAASSVVQHEINHLDGILLEDIGLEIDERFDEATQEEREELINAFLDSLDLKSKELDKEIQSDEDLKQISDAIDFMTKAENGEVELTEYEAPPAVEEE